MKKRAKKLFFTVFIVVSILLHRISDDTVLLLLFYLWGLFLIPAYCLLERKIFNFFKQRKSIRCVLHQLKTNLTSPSTIKKLKISGIIAIALLAINIIIATTLLYSFGAANHIYYSNGSVKYKGSVVNGVPNGKGKLLTQTGNIKAEGDFKDGKLNGNGKLYQRGALRYEGFWKNGSPHRHGKLFYSNGNLKYEGRWKYGNKYGKGSLYNSQENLIFEGNFIDGIMFPKDNFQLVNHDGYWDGSLDKNNSITYKGKWTENVYKGNVKFFTEDMLIYEGYWKHGLPHGNAVIYQDNGNKFFDGSFLYGQIKEGDFYNQNGEKVSKSMSQALINTINNEGERSNYYIHLNIRPPQTAKETLTPFIDAVEQVEYFKTLESVIEPSSDNIQFKSLMYQFIQLPHSIFDKDLVIKSIGEMQSIPIEILEDLVCMGAKFRFVYGHIGNQPEFEKNMVLPWGSKLTERTVGIAYYPKKLAITRIDYSLAVKVSLHEIGHLVDILLYNSISYEDEFYSITSMEAENVFKRKYYTDCPGEYFAEFFAYFYIDDKTMLVQPDLNHQKLIQVAPLTYNFFLTKVEKYDKHKSKEEFTSEYYYKAVSDKGIKEASWIRPTYIQQIVVEKNSLTERLKGGYYNIINHFLY
ncbi:hypothetical protein PRVXT_001083 [Proteinivorax tanatarense]|uniref:ATLF-like domain-containing protein n=1 Tax=Proteinivorax tanatarense TaxID=1260629 RepID=A0AAU7VPE2_9FIRM